MKHLSTITHLFCISWLGAQSVAFAQSPRIQWKATDGGNNHYYEVPVPIDRLSWDAAKQAAEAKGGYLATITSQAENDFIKGLLPTGNWFNWIGGTKLYPDGSVGEWRWITGEPWSYTNWSPGNPNYPSFEHVAQIYGFAAELPGTWNDSTKTSDGGGGLFSYVIEYDGPMVPLAPQKIFLAFDQPSSFGLIKTVAFATGIPILKPFSSMRAASVDAAYRSSVTDQVKNIFTRSDVNNIDWVSADSDDAIVVYFCPEIDSNLSGWSRGIDQFNSKRRGEVVVFVDESLPDANWDAETAAHEIGHCLGLRHVNPSFNDDPDDNEVMDYDFSSEPQFLNAITKIFYFSGALEVPKTHNPLYHLLRYVEGWSPTHLDNLGIQPGKWDTGASISTKLSFGESSLRLYNINIYVSGGDFESTFVIEQIASATLSELSQRSFTIPGGMPITLLASSTEGGPPDVISATGDPFVGENQHVAVDAATTPFSLYRQDSPTVAVPIASATAESDLTTPYCNLSLTPPNILRLDFRGTLQQSTNLFDWLDIGLDTTSPHFVVIPPGQGTGFFRSKHPATP